MNNETAPATGNEESLKHGVEHVREAAETLLRTTVEETGAEWRREVIMRTGGALSTQE